MHANASLIENICKALNLEVTSHNNACNNIQKRWLEWLKLRNAIAMYSVPVSLTLRGAAAGPHAPVNPNACVRVLAVALIFKASLSCSGG